MDGHDAGSDRFQKNGAHPRVEGPGASVAGSSEKSFEADGVRYSHIMDPRTGRPAQGVLSVAVLTTTGTAGDALDNAFFVLGPERSRAYLHRLHDTEVDLLPAGREPMAGRSSASSAGRSVRLRRTVVRG